MSAPLDALYADSWTLAQLGQAIQAAAQRARLVTGTEQAPRVPDDLDARQQETLDRWVLAAADMLGVEAEPVMATFQDLLPLAQNGAPAILTLPPRTRDESPRYLALVGKGREPLVLGADLQTRRADPQLIAEAIGRPYVSYLFPQSDMLLDAVHVPANRRAKARRLVIEQQLGNLPIYCGWLLRVAPSANVRTQARVAQLWKPLAELLSAQVGQLAVLILVWWFIGRITLTAEATDAWLQAWALALLTGIPFQLWLSSAQNRFATRLGILFRQRLMYGSLQLHPDDIRHEGFGAFFERMMAADQIELLGLSGGVSAALAIFQLVSALAVLAVGAGGMAQALILVVFILAALGLAWNYARTNNVWDTVYSKLTNELVERMIGHRTRLAQQDPREWHVAEDDDLERYYSISERFDRSVNLMDALPRLWVVVGVAGLVPTLLNGSTTPVSLAISLGGILLAFGALSAIAIGFKSLVGAGKAWRQVRPLFQAASRHKPISPVLLKQMSVTKDAPRTTTEPVIRTRNVSYRYTAHAPQVLNDINCEIFAGDRVLVEGPSGGGKTTLAAVLAGLRQPEAGQVLTRGFARAGVENEVMQRRVVMAPQFHENYVFSATMAFNLLMGRRWPPTDADISDAYALCAELGLGELLERMPSGMSQMVGDNGWQLSHGEKSRIYIARALLQHADLLILDESFGALDPENLQHALETTLRRAPTLMVIAHP